MHSVQCVSVLTMCVVLDGEERGRYACFSDAESVQSPRMRRYCEAKMPLAETYTPLPDAQLVHVQVYARHGDRSPLHLPTSPVWDCARSAASATKVSPCTEPAELTRRGHLAMMRFGTQLRRIYVDLLKFMPDVIADEHLLHVRATSRTRTQHSALALALGLYPTATRAQRHVLSMLVLDDEVDSLLGGTVGVCKAKSEALGADLMQDPVFRHFQQHIAAPVSQKLVQIVAKSSDPTLASRISVPLALDALHTRYCHDLPLPPCSDPGCTTDLLFEQALAHLAQERRLLHRELAKSAEYNRIEAGSLLAELRDGMLQAVPANTDHPTKMQLFLGHDDGIYALLGLFHATRFDEPPYGANFVIELWKDNAPLPGQTESVSSITSLGIPTDYWVRILYNGKPLQVDGDWCDFNAGCSLHAFLTFINHGKTLDEPGVECSSKSAPITSTRPRGLAAILPWADD